MCVSIMIGQHDADASTVNAGYFHVGRRERADRRERRVNINHLIISNGELKRQGHTPAHAATRHDHDRGRGRRVTSGERRVQMGEQLAVDVDH